MSAPSVGYITKSKNAELIVLSGNTVNVAILANNVEMLQYKQTLEKLTTWKKIRVIALLTCNSAELFQHLTQVVIPLVDELEEKGELPTEPPLKMLEVPRGDKLCTTPNLGMGIFYDES